MDTNRYTKLLVKRMERTPALEFSLHQMRQHSAGAGIADIQATMFWREVSVAILGMKEQRADG